MKHKTLLVALGLLVLGALTYLVDATLVKRSATPPAKNDHLTITTSFYPLYFLTSEITGEKADVYNITPAGAEPHDYEPTARDLARIEDSDLLVLNGSRFEPWAEAVVENIVEGSTTWLVWASELDQEGIQSDPHVWLDPTFAKKIVAQISQRATEKDPGNAAYYQKNQLGLEQKLDALDQNFREGLSKCATKDFITSHEAFGHLATRYGLNQVAISGISPDEDPSPEQLAKIAAFAKKNRVQYIFFETLVSPKLSQTIAREVGAQTLVLNPLEGLSDEEIAAGKNYFTVMQDNLRHLRTALACQ